ncbi:hypothetical protein L596_005116 [Steinernema carpocapsae]|uniref:Uncharacterized protein n=1 Tax=Steinernema carpocapsae TaxID=34508 RepID=A0A4U8V1K3_STECR|nr:hypothetical protein L596_005116 [Steinernema carpocapsae]
MASKNVSAPRRIIRSTFSVDQLFVPHLAASSPSFGHACINQAPETLAADNWQVSSNFIRSLSVAFGLHSSGGRLHFDLDFYDLRERGPRKYTLTARPGPPALRHMKIATR